MEWIDVLPEAIRDPLLQKVAVTVSLCTEVLCRHAPFTPQSNEQAMSLMMIKDKHKLAVAALPVAFLLAYIPHFIKIGVVG